MNKSKAVLKKTFLLNPTTIGLIAHRKQGYGLALGLVEKLAASVGTDKARGYNGGGGRGGEGLPLSEGLPKEQLASPKQSNERGVSTANNN